MHMVPTSMRVCSIIILLLSVIYIYDRTRAVLTTKLCEVLRSWSAACNSHY